MLWPQRDCNPERYSWNSCSASSSFLASTLGARCSESENIHFAIIRGISTREPLSGRTRVSSVSFAELDN